MADIALVDDHNLLRNGLANLLTDLGHNVVFEASNGREMIDKLSAPGLPTVALLDINMPIMDGYDTASWLKQHHPEIKILALSMYDDEHAIIRMLKSGARGYILKDCNPSELKEAITSVELKGYYHSELVTAKLIRNLNGTDSPEGPIQDTLGLNEREMEFLKLVCTELTYKEIADQMHLSPRTIDGYRDALFEKLHIKSRVGLVLFAIKNCIVRV